MQKFDAVRPDENIQILRQKQRPYCFRSRAKVLNFCRNFQSLDDGKNIAKSQADEGADIIFPVAGPVGLGSAQFAKESGGKVKIIGVDVDMSISNPDAAEVYIASVLKNIDAAVLAAITDTVNGVKTSDNYVGTLANGGVGVAYTAVPAELQAEVE
ncbi:MAG: BMP family ABC transporter substrate-binding protein, partial [Actinobacteria bacterium]|nr:BMP family ABC transporter substrate-binding protein [Actinomycetota bacterium]